MRQKTDNTGRHCTSGLIFKRQERKQLLSDYQRRNPDGLAENVLIQHLKIRLLRYQYSCCVCKYAKHQQNRIYESPFRQAKNACALPEFGRAPAEEGAEGK